MRSDVSERPTCPHVFFHEGIRLSCFTVGLSTRPARFLHHNVNKSSSTLELIECCCALRTEINAEINVRRQQQLCWRTKLMDNRSSAVEGAPTRHQLTRVKLKSETVLF